MEKSSLIVIDEDECINPKEEQDIARFDYDDQCKGPEEDKILLTARI